MYGGSTNKDSKLYAPYLIYNEMILDAFKQNCDVYDMGGVFALDASDGLWQIKHGFVQKETEYIVKLIRYMIMTNIKNLSIDNIVMWRRNCCEVND